MRLRRSSSVFTLCGIGQTSANIVLREAREICEHFLLGHARSKIFQHIVNRNPHPANTRLPAPLARLDSDDVAVVHDWIIAKSFHLSSLTPIRQTNRRHELCLSAYVRLTS